MVPTQAKGNTQFNDLIEDVESSVRDGIEKLSAWSDQVRHVIEEKPGTLASALGMVGFLAGTLIRRGDFSWQKLRSGQISSEPLAILVAGALAGFAFGPRLMTGDSGHRRGPVPVPRAGASSESRH